MKNQVTKVALLFAAVIGTAMLAACGSTGSDVFGTPAATGGTTSCVSSSYTSRCPTLRACCSSTQCYYVANGTTYNCNGTNCNSAAQTVANACI